MIYIILTIALALRLILINQSFWLDEAASLIISRQNLPQLLSSLAGDFHPPLYYTFLHFYLKLGITSEWFLRLPNLAFSLLTIWLLYKFLNLIFDNSPPKLVVGRFKITLPALAALLLAVNPLHIYYAQELRMFSLCTLLTLSAWYALILYQKKQNSTRLLAWVLLTVLNLYTFYGSFFTLFTQLIYLVIYHRSGLKATILWLSTSLLLFAPWLPTFIKQLQGSRFLTQALPGWSQLSGDLTLKNLLLIPSKFILGRINLSSDKLYLLLAGVSLIYVFSILALSLGKKTVRALWLYLSIPLLLAAVISLKLPMLGYWRYLYLLPAFSALLAVGIFRFPAKLSLVNIFLLLLTFLFSNTLFWLTPQFHRENWRQAGHFVSQRQDQKTISLFAFSEAFAPIQWYAPSLNYSAPLTNLSADPAQLDTNLSQATTGKNTIYYFQYLSGLTDPNHNITAWLTNAGYKKVDTHNFPGVGFVYQYQY